MRILRRIVQGIIKIVFLTYQTLQGKYKFIKTDVKVPNEPVLFLSNHQLNLDAVRLRAHNNRRIAFVAHDEIYRNKFYKWIATNIMDMICRGTSKTDISYIKDLFRAKKKGLSIGIYPEGGINYFNHSCHFDISIAKLCKKLNMPIVLVNSHGGSFIHPRWVKYKGHNKVEFRYKRLITKEELANLSNEELYDIIRKDLYVNDYDWQRETLSKVNRKCPTLNLSQSLFVCPECHSLHKLAFSNDTICCNNCKNTFSLDQYDFVTGSQNVKDLVQWDLLQYSVLEEYLKTKTDEDVLLEISALYNRANLEDYFNKKNICTAKITLKKTELIVETLDNAIIYPVKDLHKIYVEFGNTLQFSYLDEKIRIDGETLCAHVWVTYIRTLSRNSLPAEMRTK